MLLALPVDRRHFTGCRRGVESFLQLESPSRDVCVVFGESKRAGKVKETLVMGGWLKNSIEESILVDIGSLGNARVDPGSRCRMLADALTRSLEISLEPV